MNYRMSLSFCCCFCYWTVNVVAQLLPHYAHNHNHTHKHARGSTRIHSHTACSACIKIIRRRRSTQYPFCKTVHCLLTWFQYLHVVSVVLRTHHHAKLIHSSRTAYFQPRHIAPLALRYRCKAAVNHSDALKWLYLPVASSLLAPENANQQSKKGRSSVAISFYRSHTISKPDHDNCGAIHFHAYKEYIRSLCIFSYKIMFVCSRFEQGQPRESCALWYIPLFLHMCIHIRISFGIVKSARSLR